MPKEYLEQFIKTMQAVAESFERVDLETFDQRNEELNTHRPLPEQALKSLEKKLTIDEIHHSTAIEGNTLSLGETALVIEKGLTITGKPLKDHLEVLGYNQALGFIKKIVQEKEKYPLSEDLIRQIHKVLFKPMEDLNQEYEHGIGFYRKNQRFLAGSRHVLPRPEKVPDLMKELLKVIKSSKAHPIRKATLFHFGLTHIHPFVDGNGRVARLTMNLLLLRNHYPIAIIPVERRGDYINSLEKTSLEYQGQDFLKLIVDCLNQTLDLYFEVIE